jgi:hypothetical protein
MAVSLDHFLPSNPTDEHKDQNPNCFHHNIIMEFFQQGQAFTNETRMKKEKEAVLQKFVLKHCKKMSIAHMTWKSAELFPL